MKTLLIILLASLLQGHTVRAKRMTVTAIDGQTVTAVTADGNIWQYLTDGQPDGDIIAILDDMGTAEITDDEIIYVID